MTHFTKSILRTVLVTASLQSLFITAMLCCTLSCNNEQKPQDAKSVAEEHNDAKFTTNDKGKDAQFLVDAAEINLEEIQLAQLAEQKGTSNDVKELGKMMEDAHTKSQSDLAELAKKKLITIPTAPTDKAQDVYKKLNDKSGYDFDKEYCDIMVDGHKDAISKFEKVSTESNDEDIRNWASASLPALRTHLDHAMNCHKKCSKM